MDTICFNVFILLALSIQNGIEGQNCSPTLHPAINNVTEGTEGGLWCSPADGNECKRQFISVTWLRYTYDDFEKAAILYENATYKGFELTNKVDYGERSNGKLTPQYLMTIQEYFLEDNGQWKCVILNDKSMDESEEITVIVIADPSKIKVDITSPEYILLGSASEYRCSCDRIYPNVSVVWVVNDVRYGNGSTNYTQDDAIYSLTSVNNFVFNDRDSTHVRCRLESTYGQAWEKEEIADNVLSYAPASLIGPEYSHDEPTPCDTLSMTCTVSGSNHQQTWLFDGDILETGSMFDDTKIEIDGNFDFGETKATNSTLVWKVNPNERSCEFLDAFNGLYQCRASAEKGPAKVSSEQGVTIMYAPILKRPEDEVNDARVNDTVTMSCEILCASPSEVAYTWTSENNRDGLEQNKYFIAITLTEDDFDDTFTCFVENGIGEPTKKFIFNEIVVETTTDLTTYWDTTEDIETTEPPGSDNREALIIANAVIWSLCGVVAVIVVCLALYHYRQIQNGKKYYRDYLEDKVLADNEETPGTSHRVCSDEYHDGKGAVGGAVDGVDDAGLYSEIKTSSQTKAYTVVQQHTKHETSNKPAVVKQNADANGTKPSVPEKPNIYSFRSSSRSSGVNPAVAPYDNAVVNVYANCDQRPVPKKDDGTITYADLALQQQDPYDEGAPPVPPKQQMADQEPVQYASIKHS